MKLAFPITKSRAAFLFSAQRLAEISRRLYFWTFTWEEEWLALEIYRRSWNRFTTALQRRTKADFAALRVWEEHQGGHGLHVHMLANERLDVNLVRVLAKRAGIGRINVRRAVQRDAEYLAKYMTKRGKIRGVRQWAALGNWQHTKVSDVEVESDDGKLLRTIYRSPAVQALPTRRRWGEARRIFFQFMRAGMNPSELGPKLAQISKVNRDANEPRDITIIWADGTVERRSA